MLFSILHNTEYVIQWVCRNQPFAHALHKLGNSIRIRREEERRKRIKKLG